MKNLKSFTQNYSPKNKSAVAFFFLFFLHGFSIGNGQQGISYNTMFNVDGKMLAVEILEVSGSVLKIVSCDLKYKWDNISITHWLRQVEFMKQFDLNPHQLTFKN